MFESLEIRVLLSATFDSTTGLLKVTGTPLADSIRLRQSGLVLTLLDNGASSTFDATKVKQISVYGLGGNDTIALRGPGGGDVSIRALLDGADGNDTLTGGLAGDQLMGGPGNDLLDGNRGADGVIGGAGIDTYTYASRIKDLRISIDGAGNDGE